MTETSEAMATDESSKVTRNVLICAIALIMATGVSVWFIFQFVDSERQRDLYNWQTRMGIVADSRHAAVERWLDQQFAHLTGLAENASLQFYAMELLAGGEAAIREDVTSKETRAEAAYLQNLLTVTAERTGFKGLILGAEVSANVSKVGTAGLALLSTKGDVLVATLEMPPITGWLAEAIAQMPKAKRGLIDIQTGNSGSPTMGFVMPVFSVQGNAVASDQVGILVGLKQVAEELYPLLRQPGTVSKTAEAVLVRKAGSVVEYLSPLRDGTPPLKRKMAADTENLAASFGIDSPGGFGLKTDYRNNEVLVVSRQFTTAPWWLVYKIDRAEALAESDSRLTTILTVFILVIGAVVATIVAVWRYGASVRAERATASFQRAASEAENMSRFMRVLADSQPAQMFAVTKEGEYTFANKAAAEKAGTTTEGMIGKDMTSVIGPIKASALQPVNEKVIDNLENTGKREAAHHVYRFVEGDSTQVYRISHIPLRGDAKDPSCVLLVADDITDIVAEQNNRALAMRQLTRTLVMLIDQKDPYSTVHSTLVSEVGVATAMELGLTPEETRTVDFAASLINLGKIFVPQEVLLKEGDLTKEERTLLSDSMLTAADLIRGVDFGVPVPDALAQVREFWDGSGKPKGLAGEEIMIAARVITAANGLVGMVSHRSHRKGMSYEKAVEILHSETGKKYDHRVVTAMMHFMENRDGKELLKLVAEPDIHTTPEKLIEKIAEVGVSTRFDEMSGRLFELPGSG